MATPVEKADVSCRVNTCISTSPSRSWQSRPRSRHNRSSIGSATRWRISSCRLGPARGVDDMPPRGRPRFRIVRNRYSSTFPLPPSMAPRESWRPREGMSSTPHAYLTSQAEISQDAKSRASPRGMSHPARLARKLEAMKPRLQRGLGGLEYTRDGVLSDGSAPTGLYAASRAGVARWGDCLRRNYGCFR